MLWLYCDNQPFSSPNDPFFEPYRAEMEIWSPRLFFYTCTNVSAAQRHKFPMGENWPENPKPPQKNEKKKTKQKRILLLECHLSPFMIVCMGSMSIQVMALLP